MNQEHQWYPLNTFRRFAKTVCGSACKICKGFGLEVETERERPCPSCYPEGGRGRKFSKGGEV